VYLHSAPQLVHNLRLYVDKRIYPNLNEHNGVNFHFQLNYNNDGYDNQYVLELHEYDLDYAYDHELQHELHWYHEQHQHLHQHYSNHDDQL